MKGLRIVGLSLVGLFCCLASVSAGDTIVPSQKLKVTLAVGTTKDFTGIAIEIDISKAIPPDVYIDQSDFVSAKSRLPEFQLRDQQDLLSFDINSDSIGATRFKIQLVEGRPDVIEALSNQRIYLFIDKPLRVKLTNGDYVVITPKALKEATLKDLVLTEQEKQVWIKARGGAHTLYQNRIDFGMRGDGTDSTRREFILTFSYFGSPVQRVPWWSLAAKGQISSNKKDPLSKVGFFPLTVGEIFGLDDPKPFSTGEVRAWIGLEGDQPLKKTRISGSFTYTTLLPNFVDFTLGDQTRLRLDPVIKLSITYWDEINDDQAPNNLLKGGKFGAELYYFIPVMERYSLLVEGEVGLVLGDSFKKKHAADDVVTRFDVTLGYEVPGADLKILAKYSFGQNDINFVRDDRMLLGLAIDLFKTVRGSVGETSTR